MLRLDQSGRVIVHSEDRLEALVFSENLPLAEENSLDLLLTKHRMMLSCLKLFLYDPAVGVGDLVGRGLDQWRRLMRERSVCWAMNHSLALPNIKGVVCAPQLEELLQRCSPRRSLSRASSFKSRSYRGRFILLVALINEIALENDVELVLRA